MTKRTIEQSGELRGPMPDTSSVAITERYLAYFRARDHREIPGSPLVRTDIDTSFVIAGMQPLMPYLRGDVAPPYPRLTDWQRCLRADDADAVGSNARKLSSFHMLGNWSIGDYGRRGAIEMALDLLTNEFHLDTANMWVTTFAGEASLGLPPDDTAVAEWLRVGWPSDRVVPLGMEDNFWSTGGPGPCGPDSEIFVDRGVARGCGRPECRPGCECDRFLEIWNLVFIEYELSVDGRYSQLPLRSVDTGLGLERTAAMLQEVETAFDIDLFAPALIRLREISANETTAALDLQRRAKAQRLIVDHARSALFAGLAGVVPGRDGRESVMRSLIRRAARTGRSLGLTRPFLGELLEPLATTHGALLTPDERAATPTIARMVTDEERGFQRVLAAGLRELDRLRPDERGVIPGERLFTLHAERGFPADLAGEILAERGLVVDWSGYERAMAAHRVISRVREA